MDLLFIIGLTAKQYANLLVIGGIAIFVVVFIPFAIRICKAFEKDKKSSFNPIKFSLCEPQDPDVTIVILKGETKPDEDPDAPQGPEPQDPDKAITHAGDR